MDSRFHQSDLGAAASRRKGWRAEFAGCLGKHPVLTLACGLCLHDETNSCESLSTRLVAARLGDRRGGIVLAPGSSFI